jgi:hypothetical protein
MQGRLTRRSSTTILAVTGALAVVGVGYGAIPGIGGVIHSCYNAGSNPSGQLRVIDTEAGAKCAKNEKALDFNQQGPKGDKGDPGPQGPKGDTGAQGPAGAAGASEVYIKRSSQIVSSSGSATTHTKLDVPAGSYLMSGKAMLVNLSSGDQTGYCELFTPDGSGDLSLARIKPSTDDLGSFFFVAVVDAETFAAPTTIEMFCAVGNGSVRRAVLTATKVGALHP